MVCVLNQNGQPLMPTSRHGHVRILLKQGLAKVVQVKPFTIQLLYDTPDVTQRLPLGIDPGRTNIGISVVTEDGSPVFEAEVQTRNKEVPKGMQERKEKRGGHRRRRREKKQRRAKKNGTEVKGGEVQRYLPGCDEPITCKGIKNKEARFNNRKVPEGRLTPTANHLLDTTVNLVKYFQKFLPITDVVLEVNKFAFMALDNPDIKKWQYQKGALYGKGSVEEAVYEEQSGCCLLCGNAIEHYHHIVPRHKDGSETLPNRAGLCEKCHGLVHTNEKYTKKLLTLKKGLDKKYGALSVLNQIMPQLVDRLSKLFPLTITDGRSTAEFRRSFGIDKTHANDAYCIACSTLDNPIVQVKHDKPHLFRQFRRHDRQACHQEKMNRNYVVDGKVVATNRRKAYEQTTISLEEYVANGGKTDNLTVKPHPPIYKQMDRIMPGTMFLVDGKLKIMYASTGRYKGSPQYYKFTDGTKAKPKQCTLVRQNAGLVCVD